MNDPQLTIVSVAMREHSPFLLENFRLQRAIAGNGTGVRWLIVDNDGGAVAEHLAQHGTPSDVRVMRGIESAAMTGEFARASYHHAAALNAAMSEVRTRFILILDPDFYIIRRGWVDDVTRNMKATGAAFFGVPWHPSWYGKYRHFPCVHCMFVDTSWVPARNLDFTPELRERPTRRLPREDGSRPVRDRPVVRWLTLLPRVLYHLTIMRRHIGRTRDTGYRIYERYFRAESVPAAIADAVAPRSDFRFPFHLRTTVGWAMEQLLPERWSYVPRGYRSEVTFAARGGPDARGRGWEEFTWRGHPFGFHVRRTKQRNVPVAQQIHDLGWLAQIGGGHDA